MPGLTKSLHIGFIGNTNNYPFLVAKALKEMGHDVVQFVDKTESLHRPESRYPDMAMPYPDWIVDISDLQVRDILCPTSRKKAFLQRLKSFDLLVLNGQGLALVGGDRDARIFCLLTGSDLEYLADWSSVQKEFRATCKRRGILRGIFSAVVFGFIVWQQRKSLKCSFGVNYFAKGLVPAGDLLLEDLGVYSESRTSFMLSDVGAIKPREKTLDLNRPFRVFNVSRLNWVLPIPSDLSPLDMKGTDILLHGFFQFLQKIDMQAELVLVRKGHDVNETQHLVKELGIEKNIVWLDEMTQADVFNQYALADVVTEQLSTSVVGMGGLDAMAAARPVIANARPEVFEPIIGEKSAVLHATTPEEVCMHLCRLATDVEYKIRAGNSARNYVENYFSPHAAAKKILQRWEDRCV